MVSHDWLRKSKRHLFKCDLISYKTPYSILLGRITLRFIPHFHQEVFPQSTNLPDCVLLLLLLLLLSCVWLFATPWTVAHQAPLTLRFPRQNTGVGCHFLLHLSLFKLLKITENPEELLVFVGYIYSFLPYQKLKLRDFLKFICSLKVKSLISC